MQDMTRMKGSVTIYFMLSLLLSAGLLFTLAEAARISCIKAKLKGITYLAADSCFAGFATEIFDDYGIMALDRSEGELISEFNGYIKKNLDYSDLNAYYDMDLYLAHHQASALADIEYLTDDNAEPFIEQVEDYMQYYLVKESVEKLLSLLGVFDEGEKIAAFVDKINEYQEVFIKIAQSVSSIQSMAERAKSVVNNPKTIIGNMFKSLQRYKETGNSIFIAQFNTNFWNLGQGKEELQWYMQSMIGETQEYYVYSEAAQEAVDEIEKELEKDQEAYSSDTISAIKEQIESLRLKTANEEDIYGIAANYEKVLNYYDKLGSLDDLIYGLDPTEMKDHILEYEPAVSYYNNLFSGYDVENMGTAADVKTVRREDSGFISTISAIFSKGLLEAVTSNGISDKKINMSSLPSAKKISGAGNIGVMSLSQVSYRNLVLAEYVSGHFSDYTSPSDDTALAYETEYIIAGKNNDKDNLKKVIKDIVLLRAGLNMISFLKDSQKMEEALLLAEAVAGFTGIAPLIETVKTIIISIWCTAESFCDVKALTSGGKVPFVKEAHEWTVSSFGLKNFSKTVIPAATAENGLEYGDYLKVLMIANNISDTAFRTMDMIQAAACLKYNADFNMASCVNSMDVLAAYSAPQLFTSFIFVRNLTGNTGGGWIFTARQEYSYK